MPGAAGVEVLTGPVVRAFFADLLADRVGSDANQNLDAAPYAPQTVDDAWLNHF